MKSDSVVWWARIWAASPTVWRQASRERMPHQPRLRWSAVWLGSIVDKLQAAVPVGIMKSDWLYLTQKRWLLEAAWLVTIKAVLPRLVPAVIPVRGLVLYWVVNNILSIAQQWYITRKIEAASKALRPQHVITEEQR